MSRTRIISYSHIYEYPNVFQGMMFSATILTIPLCVSPLHCYTRFRVLFSATILTKTYCGSPLHRYTRFRVPSCPGGECIATTKSYRKFDFFLQRMLLSLTTVLNISIIFSSQCFLLYLWTFVLWKTIFLEFVCLS